MSNMIQCPRCMGRPADEGSCSVCGDVGLIYSVHGGQGRDPDQVIRDSYSVLSCIVGGAILVLAAAMLLAWAAGHGEVPGK